MKIVLIAALAIAVTSQARTRLGLNNNIRQNYISPRALGMGNAFTTMADDHNVLMYNPGGLAFLKEGNLNLKLQLGGTPALMGFYNDSRAALDRSEAEKAAAVEGVFARNFGNEYNFRPVVGGIAVWPGSGFAFIPIDLNFDLGIHQNLGPTLSIEAYSDTTMAYGIGEKYMEETLGVGATAKAVYRGYVGKALPVSEFIVNSEYFSKRDSDEGLTVDVDIGALWMIPSPDYVYLSHSFSGVLRNVVDYGFKTNMHLLDANSQEPPKLGRRLDLGYKLQGKQFSVFTPALLFDMKDIGHEYWTWRKGMHLGIEFLWDVRWWLRGGYRVGVNQGYLTAGASAQFVWFRMDLATWGEEMGTTNAPKQNRRFILAASLDF